MDSRITKTLDYIEDNLHLQLALSDLAKVACMSQSQFHRTFKKETKRTPFIFIEEIKMAKAYELISEGKGMVHEMATHLGYKDYETFSRAFKKHFLLSPDDLKSIALRLKDEVGEDGKFLIATVEDEDEEAILKKINQVIEEHGISIDDLKDSKPFKVILKSDTAKQEQLIKNKYELTFDGKLWESLIRNIK